MIKFSLIIPVYNEKESVVFLYMSLRQVMDKLAQPYEIIFVDDCSLDGTFEALSNLDLRPANLIVAGLNKHSGQSVAMQAGFDISQGEWLITMDGDLQNDPEDIILLRDEMIKGNYDIVCGWRHQRNDPLNRLLVSKIACVLRRVFTKENIHDFGCSFRIFKRGVLNNIYFSGGMHRFFVLIMHKLGYKIGEMKVKHNARRFGKSKYNLYNRLFECLVEFTSILLFDTHKVLHYKAKYQVEHIIRK
ncbi:MAG: glycosyltransferase family 2 protein [Candidatus Omnitrophota bacterium]